ncbi:hypothetical protein ALP58_102496 [Pseudomonas savastanoi]|uniref:Uncharacterized protein n=2 Tax=Pseudomonas syringae group TaxID=136849 RepID=A0A3M5HES8_PSESS|nr:hypothetical protein ALO79_100696 [Pseudomonas syringae pv. castaneae]RMS73905.1 hypothetical protein ALP59_102706 [Pseudomonas savastanoi]RMS97379.1 hypothetical protein ALP58_102496 [Pseudomonas savastanoi]
MIERASSLPRHCCLFDQPARADVPPMSVRKSQEGSKDSFETESDNRLGRIAGPLHSQSAEGHFMNEIPTPVTGFITCRVLSRFRPKTMYDYPILVWIEFERQ